jgi:hypothetical protein
LKSDPAAARFCYNTITTTAPSLGWKRDPPGDRARAGRGDPTPIFYEYIVFTPQMLLRIGRARLLGEFVLLMRNYPSSGRAGREAIDVVTVAHDQRGRVGFVNALGLVIGAFMAVRVGMLLVVLRDPIKGGAIDI